MSFKVAVASTDGKVINQHFGRSRCFLIFSIWDNDGYEFMEFRENMPLCDLGEHSENMLEKSADLLSDCRYVLVSHIGPGAEQVLKRKGVQPFAIVDFIDNAITKLINYEKRKKAVFFD